MIVRTYVESELDLWEAFAPSEESKAFHGISPLKWRFHLLQTKIKPKPPEMMFFFLWNFIHDLYIFSPILLSEDHFSAQLSVTHFLCGPEIQNYSSLIQSTWLELESYLNEINIIVFRFLNILINDNKKHGLSETKGAK